MIARRGVALIIAISVLAALLFLALPFVFSQSASVAGSRASAWDGMARRGADRAAGLATAMTVYATGLHRSPALVTQLGIAQQSYVQLPLQINDSAGAIGYPSYIDTSWRLVLDSGADWRTALGVTVSSALDGRDAVHGAVIEDESRRIDPNVLGERGWAIVLARAGIIDPFTVYWNWGNKTPPPNPPTTPTNLASVGYWSQADFGRLARTLSWWRPANSGRFNRLEDLLGADPNEIVAPTNRTRGCTDLYPAGHDRTTGAAFWPPPASSEAIVEATRNDAESDAAVKSNLSDGLFSPVNGSNQGYRVAPLTQAELERLRPFLSFLVPGQGRSGLIDVGTVVVEAPNTGDWSGWTSDELSPSAMGMGLALRPHNSDRLMCQPVSGNAVRGRDLSNQNATRNAALALDAAPALNINTVPATSGITRLFSPSPPPHNPPTKPGWPVDPTLQPVSAVGLIGRLSWLDGRTGDGDPDPKKWFERPPLGILGFGIVAIEGAATARDREGSAVAQRRHRTVVQAVSQERPFEAAWRTQGEFEALIRARHGSWIQAGPHPTNRIADWGSGDGEMAALDGAGWIEPAPLCTFVSSKAVTFDWLAPFGLGKAQSWNDVLKQQAGNGALGADPVVQPAAVKFSGLAVGALTAQGLRLRNGDQLAYAASAGQGPLHFTGSTRDEMASRQVSMRFMLPSLPAATVTLCEVRNQQDPSAGAAAANDTSLWRVEYRPPTAGQPNGHLVLVIANAALPWTAADRSALMGGQDWMTDTDAPGADEDARTIVGGFRFAPADPATRVEYRYVVPGGLTAGRWYQLQAFCAADRPGLHGLTLDGMVGRDATRPLAGAVQLGDHYTWPSVRITAPITPSDVKGVGGSALLVAGSLAVTYPAELNLADILPERGQIRIDDEFFSYTGLAGTAGTGTLTGVQRARRVNTNQAASQVDPANAAQQIPDADQRWPVTEPHVAEAIATPGWAQADRLSGQWLRGHGLLKQDFQPDTVTGTVALTLTGTNVGWKFPPTGGTVTLTSGSTWPDRGLMLLTWPGGSAIAAFQGPAPALTLEWGGAPVTATPPDDVNASIIDATLISLEIDGAVTDTASQRLWQDGGAAQLLDLGNGRCEWIRISTRTDRDAIAGATITGKYLLNNGGWNMVPYTAPNPPQPLAQPRGAMRTARRSIDAWPKTTTLVLPVQTMFDLDRLESGDVVTLVPDTVVFGTNEPTRLVVRHAARDAFPTPASLSDLTTGPRYDTRNEWFALAQPVPDSLADPNPLGGGPAVPQTALIGRGWCGDDLSMVGNSPARRGAMPRNVLVGGGAAKIFLGSADVARATTPDAHSDPRAGNAQDLLIDDLCAGPLPGPSNANTAASAGNAGGCEIVEIGGSVTGVIGALATDLPLQVTASVGVFQRINNQTYGLCLIDGEAFAYRRIDDTNALLIGRGLLGTTMTKHALAPDPATTVLTSIPPAPAARTYREVRPTLPVVRLPLGPVGELCSALAPGDQGTALDVVELPIADYYRDPPASGFSNAYQGAYASTNQQHLDEAPVLMINDPGAAREPELLRLLDYPTQANQRTAAPWLRGLYGTQAQTWTPGWPNLGSRPSSWIDQDPPAAPFVVVPNVPQTALNPIIIAWWPRFAPGLPATLPSGTDLGAILRCRSFAWAGFPLRLSGCRFDKAIPALAAVGIADIPVASTGDASIEARALAAGNGASQLFDWDQAVVATLAIGPNAALTSPFWSRFQAREVDGAEMRIHWTPTVGSGLTGLAAAVDMQGRTPRLGATDAEAQIAPNATAGVRMRCVAPTRVLAVEEVR